jgi:hypothetical protein
MKHISDDTVIEIRVPKALYESIKKELQKKKAKKEGYMGTQYGSSEDMAVDMVKKGITEKKKDKVAKDKKDK